MREQFLNAWKSWSLEISLLLRDQNTDSLQFPSEMLLRSKKEVEIDRKTPQQGAKISPE